MKRLYEQGSDPVVLLIDDDEDQLFIYKMLLEREGYQVISVGSAQAGLDVLSELHVDVVVCDVMMPGMDGKEFICRAREQRRRLANLPILTLTAGPDSLATELINSGANTFCSKRSSSGELMRELGKLVSANQRAESLLEQVQERFIK